MNHYDGLGYGVWPMVIANILLMVFVVFIVFRPRTKADWKSMGALSAFFVALFTEMYGFPLTIYLLTSWLGRRYPVIDPFSHNNGHLLQVFFDSPLVSLLVHPGSELIIIAGLIIIAAGWKKVHRAQGELVTDGIYKYVRHPQYTGFFLIIIAFLLQWPTLITLAMAPVLLVVYRYLARKEEQIMLERFQERYAGYMESTNQFFPSLSSLRRVVEEPAAK